MTKPKQTSTDRVAALRERRAALGLVRVEHYIHASDRPKVAQYVERLNRARFPK